MPPPAPPRPGTPALKLKRGHATTESSEPASSKPSADMRQGIQERERAALVLGSWERLAWHSRSYGESIPQTRLRFQKMMIGLEAESGEEEWEDEGEEGDGGGGKGKGKGRERGRDERQKRIRRGDGDARKSTAGKG